MNSMDCLPAHQTPADQTEYSNSSDNNLQLYLDCLEEPFDLNSCYFGFSIFKYCSTVLRFVLCLSP